MHLFILFINIILGHTLGFRHRKIDEEIDFPVYRAVDIACSLFIACLVALLLAALGLLIRNVVPAAAALDTFLFALIAAGFIFSLTTWMPFLEHLSLLAPGELTPRGRRALTFLARGIPYLYGIGAIIAALVLSTMLLFIITLGVLGLVMVVPNLRISLIPSWLAVIIVVGGTLGYAFLLARGLIMVARVEQDWGLPAWRTFAIPGQAKGIGSRIFDALDATLGRLVLMLTEPTPEMRQAVGRAGMRSLKDYRRFDGDPIDLFVSLIVAGAVLALIITGSSALLGWIAPTLQATLFPPATTTETPTPTTADIIRMLLCLSILLPALFGSLRLLKLVAQRSADAAWARQRWVRWLARGVEALRIISCALFALAIGGVVAATLGSITQLPILGVVVIFAGTALLIAWALLGIPLGQDSLIGTFLTNVALAQQHEPASTDASHDQHSL